MFAISLNEDLYVHSTFSDGVDTLERNLAVATERGLVRLGCVEHVRRDTTYVPDYVRAVQTLRQQTSIELTIGVEAKMLDASGALDLPESCAGVELVYVTVIEASEQWRTPGARVVAALAEELHGTDA